MGIEPGGNENELRLKRLRGRGEVRVERRQVFGVAAAGHHGQVQRRALARAPAALVGVARAGVEGRRVAVHAAEEHTRVVLERMLRAVAVMNVEIEDQHPLDAVAIQQPPGRQRDVVEQAKPHRQVPLRVMPGRAHHAKSVLQYTPRDAIGRIEHAPRRQQADVVTSRTDSAVGAVDVRLARDAVLVQAFQVRPFVIGEQFFRIDGDRRQPNASLHEAARRQSRDDRVDPRRPLRMMRPSLVRLEYGIKNQSGSGHSGGIGE